MVSSPPNTQARDGSGDVAMQDAGDSYSGVKYPMRPLHQQHLSTSSRSGLHQSPQEQSSAAQRYSPMEALSGAAPFTASPQTTQNPYSSRQSPTRPGSYSSPNSYYSARPQTQQLPPITPYSATNNQEAYPQSATTQLNALFGNDVKSPRRPAAQEAPPPPPGRGPVPQFAKIRSVAELQPKINAQPAFRRANPEGGFISVSRNSRWHVILLIPQFSHCKLSRHIFLRRIEYAIQALNTNHHAIHGEFSQSPARVRRMMDSITKIVIIFYM